MKILAFSILMEDQHKDIIKWKMALSIRNIISEQKAIAADNKVKGIRNDRLITSLHKLAASSGVEFAIIQKIASAQRNPVLTTLVAIADGFGINSAELFSCFDRITDEEVMAEIEKRKKEKARRKKKK